MAATITVICPSCSNRMRASAEFIGKRGRCPNCKALVEIAPSAEESQRSQRQQPVSGSSVAVRRSYRRTTDAKGWLAGLIGIAATVVLYAAVFYPTSGTYFGQLFVSRGPVPFVTTLFMCWGAAMLVLKYLAVRQQRGYSELELELIPLDVGLQVTPDNVDQFLDHLSRIPDEQRQSILGRRIQGALEHFKQRNSVPEVQEYLSSQSDLDSSGVDAGYTMLRAFIWAIPILGFIGTVMGISDAVTGLKDAMPSAAVATDGEDAVPADAAKDGKPESVGAKMMKAMGKVTDGLATAFDTTLIALVMAIMLLFPTEWLRKTEYRMLDRIEEFANESLLRRMSEGDAGGGETPEFIRVALEGAFQEHQRWLAQWQAQVATLGQVIGESFESAIMDIQEKIAVSESERLKHVKQTADLVGEMFDQFSQVNTEWQQASEQAVQNIEASLDAATKLQHAVAENTRAISELSEKQTKVLGDGRGKSDDGLRDELRGLRNDIKQLASAQTEPLSDLQPISVDNERRSTGFLGLFRSRNARKD